MLLGKETYVNIGAVVFMAGAILWATTQFAQTHSNATNIQELQRRETRSQEHLIDIEKRLSRIEGKLDNVIKRIPSEAK